MARGNRLSFRLAFGAGSAWLLLCLLAAATTLFAQPPAGQTISAIEILGNRRVERSAIRAHISARVGSTFDEAVVDADIKAIYEMGLFRQVTAGVQHRNGKLVLIYRVRERPYISDVKLEGMKEIKSTEPKVQEAVKVRPGSILDPNSVDATIRGLKQIYEDKGYLDAKIVFHAVPGPSNSAVAVFHVDEGPLVEISRIIFHGNKALSDRELRSVMRTRPHNILSWLFQTGVLDPKVLEQDRQRLSALYYEHGYLDVRIAEPVVTRHGNTLTISIDIDEGHQFHVGNVAVQGDLKVPASYLIQLVTLKKGTVFRPTTMQHDVITLSDFYSNRGYAFVNVAPRTQVNPDKHTVNVTFQINPGHEVVVDRINIVGNTRTADKVIRRELAIQEQEPYSAAAIQISKRRLDSLGIFSGTQFSTSPGRTPNQIDLNVRVHEAQTGSFSVAGGFDSSSSLFGDFHVGENNLFGGGQRVAFDAMVGYLFRNYTASYTDPWFLDMPLSAGVDLFDWEEFLPSYTRKSTGFRIRTRYPLAQLGLTNIGPISLEPVDAGLNYTFQSVGVEGIAPFTSEQILRFKGYSLTSEISPVIRRFTVDNVIDPRSGSIQQLTLNIGGLGGDNYYLRGLLHLRFFFPVIRSRVWGEWVYEIGGDFGIGTNLGGGTAGELPIFERFFPGGPYGPDAVPGYPFYSLGPRVEVFDQTGTSQGFENVGGSKELILEHQISFPLVTMLGLRGYVFMDAGNAFALHDSINLDKLQAATGVGLFWRSPFGPLRLAIGFPINPRPDDGTYDFILGAGANL